VNLTEDLTRVKNRIQKILEDGNIKLSIVVSDIFGVWGLKLLKQIAKRYTHPDILITKVTTKIKKMEEMKKAFTNCLTSEHCFVINELMN